MCSFCAEIFYVIGKSCHIKTEEHFVFTGNQNGMGVIPMITDDRTARERRFEKVYRVHVDNIYKICLHYLRDEKKAADLTVKVFFNYYTEHGAANTKYTFGRLVNETKGLLISGQDGSAEVEELKE